MILRGVVKKSYGQDKKKQMSSKNFLRNQSNIVLEREIHIVDIEKLYVSLYGNTSVSYLKRTVKALVANCT